MRTQAETMYSKWLGICFNEERGMEHHINVAAAMSADDQSTLSERYNCV